MISAGPLCCPLIESIIYDDVARSNLGSQHTDQGVDSDRSPETDTDLQM